MFRYFTSFFYERLANPMQSLDESVQNLILRCIGRNYLRCNIDIIKIRANAREKNNDHLTFMNQWIHQMKTPLSVIELITQDEVDSRFESINEETDRLKRD